MVCCVIKQFHCLWDGVESRRIEMLSMFMHVYAKGFPIVINKTTVMSSKSKINLYLVLVQFG